MSAYPPISNNQNNVTKESAPHKHHQPLILLLSALLIVSLLSFIVFQVITLKNSKQPRKNIEDHANDTALEASRCYAWQGGCCCCCKMVILNPDNFTHRPTTTRTYDHDSVEEILMEDDGSSEYGPENNWERKNDPNRSPKVSLQTISSLGRTFRLGALYDMNSDKIIPGASLWNWDSINVKKRVKKFDTVETHIITDDSLFSKMHLFNIKFDLTATIIQIIHLKGSVGLLLAHSDSTHTEQVSMMYKSLRKQEELDMELLMKLDHPLEKIGPGLKSATHVVTKIEYGNDAIFTFEHHKIRSNGTYKFSASITIAVSIFIITASAKVHGSYENKLLQTTDEIDVKFFGDAALLKIPVRFNQSVNFSQKFPDLLRTSEPIPKVIYLMPIKWVEKLGHATARKKPKGSSSLNSEYPESNARAHKNAGSNKNDKTPHCSCTKECCELDSPASHDLGHEVMSNTIHVHNCYTNLKKRLNELLQHRQAVRAMPSLKDQLTEALNILEDQFTKFKVKLKEPLKKAKQNGHRDQVKDLLNGFQRSVICLDLKKWIDIRNGEAEALEPFFNPEKRRYRIATKESDMADFMFNSNYEFLINFRLEFYHKDDKFLNFANNHGFTANSEHFNDWHSVSWLENIDHARLFWVLDIADRMAKSFVNLKAPVIITVNEKVMEQHENYSITAQVYKEGVLYQNDTDPPMSRWNSTESDLWLQYLINKQTAKSPNIIMIKPYEENDLNGCAGIYRKRDIWTCQHENNCLMTTETMKFLLNGHAEHGKLPFLFQNESDAEFVTFTHLLNDNDITEMTQIGEKGIPFDIIDQSRLVSLVQFGAMRIVTDYYEQVEGPQPNETNQTTKVNPSCRLWKSYILYFDFSERQVNPFTETSFLDTFSETKMANGTKSEFEENKKPENRTELRFPYQFAYCSWRWDIGNSSERFYYQYLPIQEAGNLSFDFYTKPWTLEKENFGCAKPTNSFNFNEWYQNNENNAIYPMLFYVIG